MFFIHVRAQCSSLCSSSSACAGWNLIKVTPTSRQRGKSPLCQLYASSEMPQTAPFYHPDGNFVCGSKQSLQPHPPPPQPAPGHRGKLPPPRPCISVIATNGSSTTFCSGSEETSVQYSKVTKSSASWSLSLAQGGVSVELVGNVSVGPCANLAGASDLQWTLLSASSKQIEVRAIDLEFAFVGHGSPGSALHLTHQQKRWCPPGTGCEEWRGGGVDCVVGRPCAAADRARQVYKAADGGE